MNPFDLKAALLAKHAQHPVIIHFPIALFIISVALDLFGIWRRNPAMVKAAYYNLVAAALTEGAKLKGNLLLHLIFALSASGMIWLLCGWRVRQRRFSERTPGVMFVPDARLYHPVGKTDCRVKAFFICLFHLVT